MTKIQKVSIALIFLMGIVLILSGHYIQKNYLSRPNIVFILIDAMRADCVDPEKSPNQITPFLSELAKKSIYFPHAITPCSWTKPTIATFLTGLPPEKHKVRFSIRHEDPYAPVSDVLDDAFLTLPEYLSENGYETYAMQTNANLVPLLGFAQGFSNEHFIFGNDAPASIVTEKSLNLISKAKPPFFLYVHYMDPHLPYIPPPEFLDMFKKTEGLDKAEEKYLEPNAVLNYLAELVYYNVGKRKEPPSHDFSEAARQELWRRYLAETRFADSETEKLVNTIKKRYSNTIFFILSDHGEEFWEHKGVGHGTSLYEEQIRVPVIIHGRGITPKKIDNVVSTAGFAKTITSIIGLTIPSQFEGSNLLKNNGNETVEIVTWGPWADMGLNLKAVLKYPWKLIIDRNNNKVELHNLDDDPRETINKSREHPEIVKELMKYIQTIPSSQPSEFQENTKAIPTDLKEQLEQLGYL